MKVIPIVPSGRSVHRVQLSSFQCGVGGDLAVAGSLEIKTPDKAIKYQKRKMWSSWLNADGFNPVAVGLRVLLNIIGGGDRAALKLEISRFEQRRSAVVDALHQSIASALVDLDIEDLLKDLRKAFAAGVNI